MENKLRGIDFASLETLRLVYLRMSFTSAAEELRIKQSSVSYTIDRLRRAFDDPLQVSRDSSLLRKATTLTPRPLRMSS